MSPEMCAHYFKKMRLIVLLNFLLQFGHLERGRSNKETIFRNYPGQNFGAIWKSGKGKLQSISFTLRWKHQFTFNGLLILIPIITRPTMFE